MSHRKPLVVIGFSGAGKSTLAEECKKQLAWNCVDVDAEVERRAKLSIAELIRVEGERKFRLIEREEVSRALQSGAELISLGGGALQDEVTRQEVQDKAIVVLLEVSAEVASERVYREQKAASSSGRGVVRPLLTSDEEVGIDDLKIKVQSMMDARAGLYQIADIKISTDGKSPDDILEELLKRLK